MTDGAAALGLLLCVLSAAFLLGAVYAASDAGGANEDLDNARRAGQPTGPLPADDRALAAMFSPVLVFTKDQRWTPIAVDDYVAGANVRDWERRPTNAAGVDDLETDCPGVVKSPCYVMTQACPAGKDDAQCAEDLPDEKAVYVRVARRSDWDGCTRTKPCADGSPDPFAAGKGDYADATEILVQYWYFYPYNEWIAPVAIGALKEVHASDWEAVTVGLSATRPLWVAYSAHCGGSFAEWEPDQGRRLGPEPAAPAGRRRRGLAGQLPRRQGEPRPQLRRVLRHPQGSPDARQLRREHPRPHGRRDDVGPGSERPAHRGRARAADELPGTVGAVHADDARELPQGPEPRPQHGRTDDPDAAGAVADADADDLRRRPLEEELSGGAATRVSRSSACRSWRRCRYASRAP